MLGAAPPGPMPTVLWVMADSPARMAAPSEVPPAALSLLTARSAVEWSALGTAASRPPCSNATTPISTLGGCALMNDSAACWAAASLFGGTSVAVMLPDTSIARMTVPLACDTGTVTAGPAAATASTSKPARVSQTPPGSRRRWPAATPAAASAAERRRATRTAAQVSPATTTRPTASR